MDLIPIRLDLEVEGCKFRDTFLWHEDGLVSPEGFADISCRDFGLSSQFKPLIVTSINEQVLNGKEAAVEDCLFPQTAVLIRLDITIEYTRLVDQFEWMLDGDPSDAGKMATKTTRELGLSEEFGPAIAHSILEQCFWIKRALINSRYSEQAPLEIPAELCEVIVPPARGSGFRDRTDWDVFSPRIFELTEKELVGMEQSGDRESRRIRKQHRTRRHQDFSLLVSKVLWTPTRARTRGDERTVCSRCGGQGQTLSTTWYLGHCLCQVCREEIMLR